MPTVEYVALHIVDNTQAVAAINREIAAYDQLTAAANRAKAATGNVVNASTISALDTFNKKVSSSSARLGNLQRKATASASSLSNLATVAGGVASPMGAASGHARSLTGSLTTMVARGLALRGIIKVVGDFGDALKEAREKSEERGEKVTDKREKARELANLMGEEGPSDRVLGRVRQVMTKSGMSFDDSLKYLEQFEGSIPAGIQKKHVREDQKGELAEEGARAARRFGLEPASAGDLAGVVSQYINLNNQVDDQGKPMTAKEVLAGQIEAMYHGASEGRGKATTLIRGELAQAAGAITSGRIESLPEMGAWIGTASTIAKSPSGTGTKFSQVDALLNTVTGKGGKFLEEAGVSAEKGDYNKIVKLKAYLQSQGVKTGEGEQGTDVQTYLAEKGFGAQEQRKSTAALMANLDILTTRRADEAARAKRGKQAVAANEAYQHTIEGEGAAANARFESAEIEQGQKTEKLMIARKNAMAQLLSEGTLDSADQLFADKVKGGFGIMEWMGAKPELQKRIDERVRVNLERDMKARGIEAPKEAFVFDDKDETQKRLNVAAPGLMDSLAAQGVNVFGGDAGSGIKAAADARDPKAAKAAAALAKPGGGKAGAAGGIVVNVNSDSLDEGAGMLKQAAVAMLAMVGGGGPAGWAAGMLGLGGSAPTPDQMTPPVGPKRVAGGINF